MRRSRTAGTSIAVGIAVFAVAGGVAFGMGQLGRADDPSALPASDPATTPTTEPEPATTPTAEPEPATPTETATPTPTRTAMYVLGDESDGVRELQARLKQIQWYLPKINGEFDEITAEAVEGFQARRELPVTGEVDESTWDRLVAMTEEPTDDELHNRIVAGPTIIGPRDSGDRVRELQARLRQIGWFDADVTGNYASMTSTAVAGFQTKRGIPSTGEVDQRTWDLLAGMTRKPTDDELHNRTPAASGGGSAGSLPAGCQTGRVLCIDKSGRTLRWVVDGEVKVTLDARFGSELTPTREGTFSVYWKSRDHHSQLYDSPMPYAMFFDGGQAVHYSPDFAANGYNGASHGCVNIRDEAAIASLFDQVRTGDKVVVYH